MSVAPQSRGTHSPETRPPQASPSAKGEANVVDYLLRGKEASRPALLLLGEERTYGDLAAGSLAIARVLADARVRKQDRVLLLAENGYFWAISYLGVLRAGAVCVPLPPNIAAEDLAYIVETTGAKVALVQARPAARLNAQLHDLALITEAQSAALPANGGAETADLPAVSADDLAALMFTSGSTGKPRGVMVSHRNIIANTDSIIECLSLTENDRLMTVLPFHYCFGTSLLHTHLRVGGTLVIDRRFMFPEKILERMLETECTGFAGVPSHFQILLRRSSLKKMTFPHLRYLQQAGGHLAPAFVRELREALPAARLFIMYGQTEATARLSCLPPEMIDRKPGSIGKAIPGIRLQVLDENGRPVGPGEIGEIVAEGDNVARGYWRAPEETAARFRDGRLFTHDLATVDEDGFIFIVDRAADFLKCGGKRVSCREVEEVLLDFDGLLEAAVVSMPDDVLGEAPKAFVVPRRKDAANLEQELHEFCKQRLPLQLLPKKIVVLDSLPKNDAGKVMKSALKQMHRERV